MEQTPSNFSCDNNKNAAFKAITKTAWIDMCDDPVPPSYHRTSTARITLAACQVGKVEARRGVDRAAVAASHSTCERVRQLSPRPDILTSHAPAMHRELMKAETVPRAQHPQLAPQAPRQRRCEPTGPSSAPAALVAEHAKWHLRPRLAAAPTRARGLRGADCRAINSPANHADFLRGAAWLHRWAERCIAKLSHWA